MIIVIYKKKCGHRPLSHRSIDGCISCSQVISGLPNLCFASQYPLTSPGTPEVLGPRVLEVFLNMSLVTAAGAISLATRLMSVPLLRWMVMMKPPPMPMLCEVTTPLQKRTATAASTAVPRLAKTSLQLRLRSFSHKLPITYFPILEHGLESTDTAACVK